MDNGWHQLSCRKTYRQLDEGEKFYNFQSVLEEIKPKLQEIWQILKKDHTDMSQLTIFGELIGGDYPHDDVPRNKQAIKVQKGIFYSPDNLFFAFDIVINHTQYLDVDIANQLFEHANLLHAKTIFKGSIEDCLAYPNDFESTIPKELNLPEITPNVIEGVIIKPLKTRYMNNRERVILKNKNEKWAEIAKRRKSNRVQEKPSDQVIALQEAILDYVTENRLTNVLSKIGEVTEKDIGKVLGLFSKDVVEDFLKDHKTQTDLLEKKELKLVTKSFAKTANTMVVKRIT